MTTEAPDRTDALLDGATCLGCGYPLRGLSDGRRCPECGQPFDPSDPESFEGPMRAVRRMRRALHWAPIAVWVATLAAVLVGSGFLAEEFRWAVFQFVWEWPSLLVIASIVLATVLRARARRALLGRAPEPHPASERAFRAAMWVACALILFLPGGVRSWSCPHGSGFGVGPVGVAHSTVGGPCRNTVVYSHKWHISGPWYAWVQLR